MPELAEIMNTTFDDVPDSVELLPGEFLFEVSKASVSATDDGEKYWYQLSLRPTEVLSEDLGLTAENLQNAYPIQDRLYFHTEGSKARTKGITEKILGQKVGDLSAGTIAEAMIGQPVRAVIKHRLVEGRDRPYLNVDNYLKVA